MNDAAPQRSASESAFSPAALDEWMQHVESVLRGIAHALNNRASAISGAIELSDERDESLAVKSILGTELERVLDLANVVFRGHVPNITSIWERNHLLVLSSRYEGTPLAR